MSTSTIDQAQAGNANGNVNASTTQETEDVVVGYNLDTVDGKVTKKPNIYAAGEAVKKLQTEGKFEEVFTVTTKLTLPKTFDALIDFYRTPEEQEEGVNNHNRGVRQKVTNRRNARLLAVDDEGVLTFSEKDLTDGFFDLTPEIASASKRKTLSEEEKLDRFLEQFPEATRNQMKQAYLTSKQAAPQIAA